MTSTMAAGQQKKRLNGANSLRFSLHDSMRIKKPKKRESSDILLNITSHISLEWDDSQGKALAKREQVGITWRDMAPFLDHVPRFQSRLADVVSVPQELFSPDNVTNVLSYEVWKAYLSEQEKKLLAQFLPSGVDLDDVVQSLFSGENLHFGNPFCNWLLHWLNNTYDSGVHLLVSPDDLGNSDAWVASLCAGNLHPDTVLHKEYQLRACRKAYFVELKKYHSGFIEGLSMLKERWANCGNPDKDTENNILRSSVENPTPPVAIEKELQEIDLENGGSKYMSYIKINKKQYRLVMNIRNSDNGIDSECLSEILGDINGFDVKPYAALEEEERKRLQDHWVKLANEDLPAAFENRGRHRALINNLKKLMHRELTMKEPVARRIEDERIKRKALMAEKEEKEKLKWTTPLEQADDIASEQEFVHETQDEGHIQQVYHHFTDCQHLDRISLLNTSNELDLESIVEHSTSPSTVGHHQERNPSLDHHMELSVDFPQGVQDGIRPGGPVAWQFLGSMTASGDAVEAKLKHSTSFPTGHSYGHPTMERQRDTPTGDLPLHRPQLMEERTSPSLDLETQILRQEEAQSVALHDNNRETMFGRYADQDRCPLQAAFQKEHVSLRSDVPEHLNRLEPSELRLSLANVAQFPSQFEEQQLMLLDLEQPGEKDPYMPQILNRDGVSRGGYLSQGHFPSVSSQESTGLQSAVIGGFSGQRWLPLEHRSCAGLSTAKPAGRAGQCMGGGSSADGSLFCVLSECNKLLSGFPQATTDSDHFPQGANIVGGGGLHQEGIYSSPPLLDSTGGRNGAAVWTNYPNQRSELSESVRKSYLPSWH